VSTSATATSGELGRHLGTFDAVVIGLGSMIGAGIFAALAPAARAAGSGLLISLPAAGLIAYCNATSSARLAARYPQSGGTYVYGRERLGDFWGYLAGWGFVVGKTASCPATGSRSRGLHVAPSRSHGGRPCGCGRDRGQLRRSAEVRLGHEDHRRLRLSRPIGSGRRLPSKPTS
jgi:APA family basic amino acid/polyamine antiporter